MEKYALIVAGGSGSRMNSARPKQFLELDGKPILVHTLEKFLLVESIKVVLVLPRDHFGDWEKIKSDYFASEELIIVAGGETRTASVLAGLNAIEDDGLVAIHDAVRPFVRVDTIERCFQSALEFGSGVAAVELKDSIRKKVGSGDSEFRDRSDYVLVQTPQVFQISRIKEAYEKVSGTFSDDATVFEMAGNKVMLVESHYSNIKITTPEDLK
ncbi:MAG: 2-C-methyl-D-erythritol 4-phosphate cytidylyltransferase [Cyclobacteriaceae bacterium]